LTIRAGSRRRLCASLRDIPSIPPIARSGRGLISACSTDPCGSKRALFEEETTMAFPTAVNDQITDSVTQANTKVLGDAPAIAMGNLYQATAQALSNAAHNATNAQQQSYVTGQAATTMGVATLYALDTAATGKATSEIDNSGQVKGLGS
jgi:hypothetical protein